MPRKPKGVHTSPEKAGAHNISDTVKDKSKLKNGEPNAMAKILPVMNHGFENCKYSGQWTDELLEQEIRSYFNYISDNEMKPSIASLSLWLAVSKAQLYEWKNMPMKFGKKTELIQHAYASIESQYIERAESYPTANLFLLRTGHGHIEASKVDVTTNGKEITQDADEIKDLVARLGLDKK